MATSAANGTGISIAIKNTRFYYEVILQLLVTNGSQILILLLNLQITLGIM